MACKKCQQKKGSMNSLTNRVSTNINRLSQYKTTSSRYPFTNQSRELYKLVNEISRGYLDKARAASVFDSVAESIKNVKGSYTVSIDNAHNSLVSASNSINNLSGDEIKLTANAIASQLAKAVAVK